MVVHHGFNLTFELQGSSPEARALFDLLTERDTLARIVRFKDELGLGRERMFVAVGDGHDEDRFGGWTSSPLSRAHRLDIYAGPMGDDVEVRALYTLAHELVHAFLYAHGFGMVHALVPAEVEGAAKDTLAFVDQLIARAEESLTTQLTELLWKRLLP